MASSFTATSPVVDPEATAYTVALNPGASWSPPPETTLLVTEGTLHSGDHTHQPGRRHRPRPQVAASSAPTRLLAVARAGSPSRATPNAPPGEP